MLAQSKLSKVDDTAVVCKRCSNERATLEIRSDKVCQKCFQQYVTTKAVKRMEMYKSYGSFAKTPKKFLLPLSFGLASTTLLYILDKQLQIQHERVGRTSYELIVAHIDKGLEEFTPSTPVSVLMERIKNRFPKFKYVNVTLDEALEVEGLDVDALDLRQAENTDLPQHRLSNFIKSIPAATSRADIVSTLLIRLLVKVAKGNDCESILFGDSITRLAEKTLTETAKGRGFSLSWQLSDGVSPYGIKFRYPLRDLLRKELLQFSSLISPPLTDLVDLQPLSSQVSSSRSITIDDLMVQYFEAAEENYPSIVANVVRTSSKLRSTISDNAMPECGLCGLPVIPGTQGIYGWGGDQNPEAASTSLGIQVSNMLCYGCSRSVNG